MPEENQTEKPTTIPEEVISRARTQLMNAVDRLMMLDTTSPVFKRLGQLRDEFNAKLQDAIAQTGLENEQAVIESGKHPHLVEALAKRQMMEDAIAQGSGMIAEAEKIVSDFFTI